MVKSVTVIAALIAATLLPSTVRAGDAPAAPPAAAAAAPSWSLSGGITFGWFVATGTGSSVLLRPLLGAIPGATGTLERRLSDRSWVYLNVAASLQRHRADVADGDYGATKDDARLLFATVGFRRALTGPGAPVEVSALAGIHGGASEGEQVEKLGPRTTDTDTTRWSAGANLGIAVQRELTDALALRLSTPVLYATYGEGRERSPGEPVRTSKDVSIGLQLAPQLELVVFF